MIDRRLGPKQTSLFLTELDEEMDRQIRKKERKYEKEKKNLYFGVKFTPEEKRLLVGIFGDRIGIARFYQEIQKVQRQEDEGVDSVVAKYKKRKKEGKIVSPWVSMFVQGITTVRPKEYDLFYGMIKKIEKDLSRNKEIMLKIDAMFGSISRREVWDNSLRGLVKSKTGQEKKEKRYVWVEELGDKRKVIPVIAKKVQNLLKKNSYSGVEELINDEKFIIEFSDKLLGRKVHRFYTKNMNGEKQRMLYILVREMFRGALDRSRI